MSTRRPDRERRQPAPVTPEVQQHIDKIASTLRAIFSSSRDHQQRLAERGVCRWDDCGKLMTGWAIEEVAGAIPVCSECAAEHALILVESPV